MEIPGGFSLRWHVGQSPHGDHGSSDQATVVSTPSRHPPLLLSASHVKPRRPVRPDSSGPPTFRPVRPALVPAPASCFPLCSVCVALPVLVPSSPLWLSCSSRHSGRCSACRCGGSGGQCVVRRPLTQTAQHDTTQATITHHTATGETEADTAGRQGHRPGAHATVSRRDRRRGTQRRGSACL